MPGDAASFVRFICWDGPAGWTLPANTVSCSPAITNLFDAVDANMAFARRARGPEAVALGAAEKLAGFVLGADGELAFVQRTNPAALAAAVADAPPLHNRVGSLQGPLLLAREVAHAHGCPALLVVVHHVVVGAGATLRSLWAVELAEFGRNANKYNELIAALMGRARDAGLLPPPDAWPLVLDEALPLCCCGLPRFSPAGELVHGDGDEQRCGMTALIALSAP